MNYKIILDKVKWLGLRKLYWILRRSIDAVDAWLLRKEIFSGADSQSLAKKKISRFLIEKFSADDGQNINYSQYFLGFGLIHYSIIRNWKPKRILIVGSRMGFIPAIAALACLDNGIGHVDFVDAGYDKSEPAKHWGGIGFWKNNNPYEHFSKLGISDRITTYVMTTEEFAKKYPKRRYQYVYIDGDHSYEGIRLDYSLFWPRLDRLCFMTLHDVVPKGYLDRGLFGVWKFWSEIKKNKIVFPFPSDSGLGIIQKT